MSKPYSVWIFVRNQLIEHLKGKAVKLALKKILGSAVAGGFKAWIIKFIVTELFEEVAEPIIKLGFRKTGYLVDKAGGHYTLRRIENAQNNDDWYDAADDV